MSENDNENASSSSPKKNGAPSKPPRPPPPASKLPRPPSIQQHLEALQGLKIERVRWFVKEDKKWVPFNGCDSLAIENCYRQILALESREEDSSKVLNTSTIYGIPIVKGGLYEVDVVARECSPIYWKDKSSPVCRGTWFTGATPDTWQPVSEEDSEQIENSHQAMWRAMGLAVGQSENDKQVSEKQGGIGRLHLKGFYVEWNDIADVWLYWDDVKSRIIRNVGGKIGFSSGVSATQLHRGFHVDACPDDKPPEITHLVFVVHGIGQLLHMSNIVKSSSDIRQCAATVLDKRLSGIPCDQRVEFIPVEWRSSLKLDEGTIESITPTSVSGLRKVLNTSMMDIMYYTSPFYRYEIIDGVRDELNRIHEKFCARNPSFLLKEGKVSLIAHSLGSVITYDILSLWDIELRHLTGDATTGTGFLTESLQYLRSVTGRSSQEHADTENHTEKGRGKMKQNLRVELAKARSQVMKLEAMVKSEVEHGEHKAESSSQSGSGCPFALRFKVENLFCVGSPLAVFLALRGLRPQDDVEDHVLPKSVCKKLVNIYHPADPVAYRLEPLISADYKSIPPVQLHRHDSSKSGYTKARQAKQGGGRWKNMFSSYRVDFNKQKADDEGNEQSVSSSSDGDETQRMEEDEEEEVVIVHHAEENNTVDGAQGETSPSRRTGWIASLFGSYNNKPSTSTNSSQETDETSATDGATDDQASKAEHITVPEKVLSERLDYALREGYMESNYWSAVTSHVSYWTSYDVARFVLENCLDVAQNAEQS